MAAYIHAVPRRLAGVVTLEAPREGELCEDCRRPCPPHRPIVQFRGERYCLTCARGMGYVVASRRPRAAPSELDSGAVNTRK